MRMNILTMLDPGFMTRIGVHVPHFTDMLLITHFISWFFFWEQLLPMVMMNKRLTGWGKDLCNLASLVALL